MINNKKVCVFVDGENLRHSINELFPDFDRRNYLPKADWAKFFDWIASEVAGVDADRIRTYWYVVENIDFIPYNLNSARKNKYNLIKLLCKDKEIAKSIDECTGLKKDQLIEKISNDLQDLQRAMEGRFHGWINIQSEIEARCAAIEFRRAGSIKFNLFNRSFGSEKAVDVKLATDLIRLKDIYDIAVIVSGDQDYVPGVDAIKDFGKRTVNVSFLTDKGYILPGGAK
ncbi:MAG: NYN domain-containing protein, partial [Candidatus Staskawiczbacteria bacterium]